jgi:methyl-accepting chemotaxis protein
MSNSQFAAILGQLPVAAFATDATGKVIGWNGEAEALFGKTAAVAAGKKAWTLLATGGKQATLKESMLAEEASSTELEVSGQKVTLLGKPHTNADGDIEHVIFTVTAGGSGGNKHDANVRAMIENSPNPTMCCDKNLTITYMNSVAIEKLSSLQQYLPVPANQLVGKSIDVFHKHPEHQRRLLADPRNLPHTARIKLGPETLRLQVYAVKDESGDYQGPALAWEIITDQVAAEERERAQAREAARVKAVVDNSPNPQMLLDLKDFRITYANDIAIKTLSKLEKHLPIRAADIIGSSVDVFHKNPEHQRRMLSDPRNLPHTARINVGPEVLELQLYALYDDQGVYTGPALTWMIITARARMEERDAEAKRAVGIVREALGKVASGDVDVNISEDFGADLNIMRDNVNEIASVLRRFSQVMAGLSDAAQSGRLAERADANEFQGAYADIIQGVNVTLDSILTPVNNIREKLGRMATGDLTAYVEEVYEGDHGALKDALNRTLDGLNDLLGQVTTAANQIATSSQQVASAAQDLSQGASEQAATIEEISAQMSQITTQTQQNAENATQANQLAVTARDGARTGDERMNEMLAAMREIEEASNNISKIIKVIDEIAFQTNLLALNAAVEAARAGVHGKGFAVVAEEVRNLAARSARAAKETTEMIEGSIKKVALGTNIARDTATALGSIVQDVGKVTDLVAEIAAASNEQAEGINQINSGLDQVNQVTQRNTATAEESAASAEEMSGQTAEMQRMVGTFTLMERSASASLPDGMTPEMMQMVQAYVQRLVGQGGAPAAAARPKPQQAQAPAPARTTGRGNSPAKIINLESSEFGKY